VRARPDIKFKPLSNIGVELEQEARASLPSPPPKKMGKIFLGWLSRKIRPFSYGLYIYFWAKMSCPQSWHKLLRLCCLAQLTCDCIARTPVSQMSYGHDHQKDRHCSCWSNEHDLPTSKLNQLRFNKVNLDHSVNWNVYQCHGGWKNKKFATAQTTELKLLNQRPLQLSWHSQCLTVGRAPRHGSKLL